MSRYRVYIKPFIDSSNYASEFTEISPDVISVGSISQSLDNSTYDIGIFKNSGLNIRLRNDHGRFGEADSSQSIFFYKRQDAIVRVTWQAASNPLVAGFFKAGSSFLGTEVTLFEGLLQDISSVSDIETQMIDFRVAGYEVLLDRVTVPYSSIANGDDFDEAMYAMLNQTSITDYVSVLEANINPPVNEEIDDKTSLENLTVKGALTNENMLLVSSSVLYIEDSVLYISTRDAEPTSSFTFYGQASIDGIENIISIKDYREGENKIYNHIRWGDTALLEQETSSIAKFGIKDFSVSSDLVSDSSTTPIGNILTEILDDFAFPKIELSLETPMTYETLDLGLKDRVNIDYPTIYTSADGLPVPRWNRGQVWGGFRWPFGQYSLTIQVSVNFKIISRKINPRNDTIIFKLREI